MNVEKWAKTTSYKVDSLTEVSRVLTKENGDYIYTAYAGEDAFGTGGLVVVKQNMSGSIIWERIVQVSPSGNKYFLTDLLFNSTGEILLLGSYLSTNELFNMLVAEISAAGTQNWTLEFDGGFDGIDFLSAGKLDTQDNLYISGGITQSNGIIAVATGKISSSGSLIWLENLTHGSLFQSGLGLELVGTEVHTRLVTQIADDKWLLSEEKRSTTNGGLITTVNSSDTLAIDEVRHFHLADNGTIHVTGLFAGSQGEEIKTVKIAADNTIVWEVNFNSGASFDDAPNQVNVSESDGRVYVVGQRILDSSTNKNGLVLAYDNSGTLEWSKNVEGAANAADAILTSSVDETNGVLHVAGSITESLGSSQYVASVQVATGTEIWQADDFENEDENSLSVALLTLNGDSNLLSTKLTEIDSSGKYALTNIFYDNYDRIVSTGNDLPASGYVANLGQLSNTSGLPAREVLYYAPTGGSTNYVRLRGFSMVLSELDTAATLPNQYHRVDVDFYDNSLAKSIKEKQVYGLDPKEGYRNYYINGVERTRVEYFDRLVQPAVYDDIDFYHNYASNGQDFAIAVHPGADYTDLQLVFSGHDDLGIKDGQLQINTSLGSIIWPAPDMLLINPVTGAQLGQSSNISYDLAGDTLKFLIPDHIEEVLYLIRIRNPVTFSGTNNQNLEWSSFFGGSGRDLVEDIETGFEGMSSCLVAGGVTLSEDFPVVSGFQAIGGSTQDGFVALFDENINLKWATYLGGTGFDELRGIELLSNKIVIVGETRTGGFSESGNSANFPLKDNGVAYYDGTNNCLQSVPNSGCSDAFVTLLDNEGVIDFSTFFGVNGSSFEGAYDIARAQNGKNYIVGVGQVPFISDGGSYFPASGQSFIAKFSADFSILEYCGRINAGRATEVEVDDSGNVFVAGNLNLSQNDNIPTPKEVPESFRYTGSSSSTDGFILKFDPAPFEVVWGTYIGGAQTENVRDLEIDKWNNVLIGGWTPSTDFVPIQNTPGGSDIFSGTSVGGSGIGFLSVFSNTGIPVFSTYRPSFLINSLDTDELGRTFLGGLGSPTLPVSGPSNSYQNQVNNNAYLLTLDNTFNTIWGTYFGTVTASQQGPRTISEINEGGGKLYIGGTLGVFPATSSIWELQEYQPNTDSYFQTAGAGLTGFLARFDIGNIVSLEEFVQDHNELEFFPNPTLGDLLILPPQGQEWLAGKELTIDIFSINGQLVSSQKTIAVSRESGISLDLNPLRDGTYFIRISAGRAIYYGKVIKQ